MLVESFKIGQVSAERGSKAYGSLRVGELHNGIPVDLRFGIVNGRKEGPVLLVTSGMNGATVSSIEAVRRLFSKTSPSELSGTLVVVPIVNEPAFLLRERSNYLESDVVPTDLFYSFPGKPNGTLTQRLADIFTREIMSKANFFVDLQNKGKRGKYEPFVVIYPGLTPASLQPNLLAFARSFGSRFISDAGGGGSISPKFAGRPQVVAGSRGIIAIMSQCGGDYRIEEDDIVHQIEGARNLMKHLAMVEGEPGTTKDQLVSSQTMDVRSNSGGFLSLSVKLGDRVRKGQIVGEVTDLFCGPLEKIEAPTDGYVTMITTIPTISSGDAACNISVARPLS
jgi:hypothetical protein